MRVERNLVAVLILLITLAACGGEGSALFKPPVRLEKAKISNSVLFPSNERVMATYCPKGPARSRKCHLAAWDLDGGNVKLYRKPAHHSWLEAMFSPDGTEVVFELNDTGRYSTKLAIMDLATEKWRIVEGSDTYTIWPSFHPNGKKLIYAAVAHTPDNTESRSRSNLYGVDIHSLNLATGRTKALTDYRFKSASRPHYTGRGDEFVFEGKLPMNIFFNPNKPKYFTSDQIGRYTRKFGKNHILIINEIDKDWIPEFVIDDRKSMVSRGYSIGPIPGNKGNILYFESNVGIIGKLINSQRSSGIWKREKK